MNEKQKKFDFKNWKKNLSEFCRNNIIFLVYLFACVFNSALLRIFTVHEYFNIKPILSDVAITLIMGSFGFLMKPKKRIIYYGILTVLSVFFSCANSIYYTNYKSFTSVSLISTASQLGGVMDAVTKNILEFKDLTFILTFVLFIVVFIFLKKKKPQLLNYELSKEKAKRLFNKVILSGFVFLAAFAIVLSPTDYSRLVKQWTREYNMTHFGLYFYHISDAVTSIQSKLNTVFGFSKNEENFIEFYDSQKDESIVEEETEDKNKYTDIFKGKNLILIHCESMQQFCMQTYINGKPLTPNLNKMAKEGIYFSNFYAQESVGTSSDSEFTCLTSLLPVSSGTVAINYYNRNYVSIPKMLGDKGYYTFSMHANKGSFWNRINLHQSLGYQHFYNYTNDYDIEESEIIGLGLNDKSFFKQSVDIIKDISEEHEKYMGTLLMLTNHTPFTDIENFSDFEVDFKYSEYNPITKLYEEKSADFLEGTKLGSYFKSVHYADEALGEFFEEMDDAGLLDNTVVVLYGDHDAKIKPEQYEYYYNYDPFTGTVLNEDDPEYIDTNDFYYALNRKVPMIIWSKDGGYEPAEVTEAAGMYDLLPTVGNMMGFKDDYALGHDIFSFKDGEENVVIFPNGNFVTNKVYYDSQLGQTFDLEGYENIAVNVPCNQIYKDSSCPVYNPADEFKSQEIRRRYLNENFQVRLNNDCVDQSYIDKYSKYAEDRIGVSNAIIYYDMINKANSGMNDTDINITPQAPGIFAPPDDEEERFGQLIGS